MIIQEAVKVEAMEGAVANNVADILSNVQNRIQFATKMLTANVGDTVCVNGQCFTIVKIPVIGK